METLLIVLILYLCYILPMNEKNTEHPYHHGNLRAEILSVAETILSQQGIDHVTMREISRIIGVSHAAPQRHFKNRQELLDAMAEEGFLNLGSVLKQAIESAKPDFSIELTQATRAFVYFAINNASLFELMNTTKHLDTDGHIHAASTKTFAPMLALIIEGQKKGALKDNEAPTQIGLILFSALLGIATMVNNGMLPAEHVEDVVTSALTMVMTDA